MGGGRSRPHDQHRLVRHFNIDPERVEFCRASVGAASWCIPFGGVFGRTYAVLHHGPYYTARVLAFPERRSELAKISDEIAEMERILLVR
jgi:hypothetical protein